MSGLLLVKIYVSFLFFKKKWLLVKIYVSFLFFKKKWQGFGI